MRGIPKGEKVAGGAKQTAGREQSSEAVDVSRARGRTCAEQ